MNYNSIYKDALLKRNPIQIEKSKEISNRVQRCKAQSLRIDKKENIKFVKNIINKLTNAQKSKDSLK